MSGDIPQLSVGEMANAAVESVRGGISPAIDVIHLRVDEQVHSLPAGISADILNNIIVSVVHELRQNVAETHDHNRGILSVDIAAFSVDSLAISIHQSDVSLVRQVLDTAMAAIRNAVLPLLVAASGAEITADSVPGRGTTVTVRMPIAPEQQRYLRTIEPVFDLHQVLTGMNPVGQVKAIEDFLRHIGGTIKFRPMEQPQTMMVHGSEHAAEFQQLRESVYMARQIAEAADLLVHGGDPSRFHAAHRSFLRTGGLIEHVSADEWKHRMDDPLWVISRTDARHPDPRSAEHARLRWAAACVCQLPPDRGAEWLFPFIRPGDIVYQPSIAREIEEADPASTAIIQEFIVAPTFGELRLASATLAKALSHVRWEVNPHRSIPIKRFVGLVADIYGIRIQGTEYIFERYGGMPFVNIASLSANQTNERWPAIPYARVEGEPISVEMGREHANTTYQLLTRWIACVHREENASDA